MEQLLRTRMVIIAAPLWPCMHEAGLNADIEDVEEIVDEEVHVEAGGMESKSLIHAAVLKGLSACFSWV